MSTLDKQGEDERRGDRGVYIISVAADLAGVHPQTLRIYERKGLLNPSRTAGNSRRYSESDIERLRAIQHLTQEVGVNLAGVKLVVQMENELDRLRSETEKLARELSRMRRRLRERLEDGGEPTALVLRSSVRPPWDRTA